MDGAIPDWEGSAYPLVVTTSQDVIGNLRKNLRSYKEQGLPKRKAVVATCRALSPPRRRNLERAAEEEGFTLIQVFDRSAIAELLYYSPEWCRELLGVAGAVPALSAVPSGRRGFAPYILQGRDGDLEWLRAQTDDALIVGQPGSGKTALLAQLVNEGWALFATGADVQALTDAIRASRIARVVLDDSHARLDVLRELIEWRRHSGSELKIIASGWPFDDSVTAALALPSDKLRVLQDLTRDEMVRVLALSGIERPVDLVRELVTQADGKPGLAVTLAQFCLAGDTEAVALGDALLRDVRSTFRDIVGSSGLNLLAVIALSADDGMSLDAAAGVLRVSLSEAREALTRLGAGGIVYQRADRVAVRPARLRQALIRDMFFGAVPLPLETAARAVSSKASLAVSLLGARFVGAAVSDELLLRLAQEADSEDVWVAFAHLGRRQAELALERHPTINRNLSGPGLQHAPVSYVRALLGASVGDARALHSHLEHPLRILEDWAKAPEEGRTFHKRQILLSEALNWRKLHRRNGEVAAHAIAIALTSAIEWIESDPGGGNNFTIHSGVLPLGEIGRTAGLWSGVVPQLGGMSLKELRYIVDLLEDWAYQRHARGSRDPAGEEAATALAKRMLGDIDAMCSSHPGIVRRLLKVADALAVDMSSRRFPEFDAIYPHEPPPSNDYESELAAQSLRVATLSDMWIDAEPSMVASRLSYFAIEASEALGAPVWPNYNQLLCDRLAANVSSPLTWLAAFIDCPADAGSCVPFLRSALQREPTVDSIPSIARCLARADLRGAVASAFLLEPNFPRLLWESAVENLDGFELFVETCFVRGQVAEGPALAILARAAANVRLAAAIGEWNCRDDVGSVRPTLAATWRTALLAIAPDDSNSEYWVGEILKGNAALAHDWLRRHLAERGRSLGIYMSADVRGAVEGLDVAGKTCILARVPTNGGWFEGLCRELIGNDPSMFRTYLMKRPADTGALLAPLCSEPSEQWADFAIVALDDGYSAEDLVRMPDGTGYSWSGEESARWQARLDGWTQIKSHRDERIRRVAEIGLGIAGAERAAALRREREEAIRP